MRSKLAAFCDAMIETGWLLALIVEPLFLNVYSSRVFEPDKLTLLRSIATIMAIAWITRWAEQRLSVRSASDPTTQQPFWQRPLVAATLFLALAQIISTVGSVAPRTSLLGSYVRLQGSYTFLAYLVVFGCLLSVLRRREQVERALTTAILSSLPVALYGLVQHYGLDPLPWGGDVTQRVASTMGNSIFVGAFLLLLVPLTLARITRTSQHALANASARQRVTLIAALVVGLLVEIYAMGALGLGRGIAVGLLLIAGLSLLAAWLGKPIGAFLQAGCYLFILSAQLLCIYFSQSRGPEIGLLVSVFFFWLLFLAWQRRRRLAALFLGAAAAVIVLLVVMNIPESPLAGIRDVPYIGRLGRLLEIESGTGKVRVLLWEAAVEMATDTPLRTAIGYGPDATFVAFSPFYPPDLAHYESRNASGDRSHNEIFDMLVMTGVLGLAAFAWLATALFYHGLTWLGLIQSSKQRRVYSLAVGAGALLGVVVPRVVDQSFRFAGVGVLVGFMLGLAAYVSAAALTRRSAPVEQPAQESTPSGWAALLIIALLASIAGHYAELSFGFGVAASRTYFWVFAAILAVVGQHPLPETVSGDTSQGTQTANRTIRRGLPRESANRAIRSRRSSPSAGSRATQPTASSASYGLYVAAALTGWALATLAWNYTTNPTPPSATAWALLKRSFTTLAARGQPGETSWGLALVVLTVWLLSLLVHVTDARQDSVALTVRGWLRDCSRYALVSSGIGIAFAIGHASRLVDIRNPEKLIYGYYIAGLLVWLGIAALLYFSLPRPAKSGHATVAAGALVLLMLGVVLIINTNVSVVAADVLYKTGLRYDGQQAWDEAISFYKQAIAMAPNEDYYYLFAGRALMERGQTESAESVRDAYLQASLTALEDAKRLNPLNADHTANMARLQRTWAELSSDPVQRSARLESAEGLYAQALAIAPNNAQLYNEWGLVYYEMGDLDRAMEKYEHSLALDDRFAQTYLLIGDVHLTRADYASAVATFRQSIAQTGDDVQSWSSLAYALSQAGDVTEAIKANLRVLELAPDDYVTLKNLAILYRETGQHRAAIDVAQRALAVSTRDQDALQQFIAQEQAALQEGDATP